MPLARGRHPEVVRVGLEDEVEEQALGPEVVGRVVAGPRAEADVVVGSQRWARLGEAGAPLPKQQR